MAAAQKRQKTYIGHKERTNTRSMFIVSRLDRGGRGPVILKNNFKNPLTIWGGRAIFVVDLALI